MNRKSLTFALAAAGLTVGGLGVSQVASAQTTDQSPETTVDGNTVEDRDGERDGGRRNGKGCHQGSEAVAEILGLEVDELRAALAEGQSLADVAEANGVDPQEIVDALVAEASERLEAKVADGDLTADEAAEKLADRTENIEERIDSVRPERDADAENSGRSQRGPRGDRSDADNVGTTEETSI